MLDDSARRRGVLQLLWSGGSHRGHRPHPRARSIHSTSPRGWRARLIRLRLTNRGARPIANVSLATTLASESLPAAATAEIAAGGHAMFTLSIVPAIGGYHALAGTLRAGIRHAIDTWRFDELHLRVGGDGPAVNVINIDQSSGAGRRQLALDVRCRRRRWPARRRRLAADRAGPRCRPRPRRRDVRAAAPGRLHGTTEAGALPRHRRHSRKATSRPSTAATSAATGARSRSRSPTRRATTICCSTRRASSA